MTRLKTTVNTGSDDFLANETHYTEKLAELHELRRSQRIGGPLKARDRHIDKGKMLPRERVERLVDPGTPFLELGDFAGLDKYDGVPPGAGIITGIGVIAGRQCMIIANDATVKGGTYFGMTCKKHVRAQRMHGRTDCRSLRWLIAAGRSCPRLPTFFRTRASLARFSIIKSVCRVMASPKLLWSWGPAQRAVPIFRRSATKL